MKNARLCRAVCLVAGAVVLSACVPASAQSLKVLQTSSLHADRTPASLTLLELQPGQSVSLLQMAGGWVQVQLRAVSGPTTGWLRASQLAMPGAEVASLSQLNTGRRNPEATAVTLGIRALPARSTRHAVIIGVGTYQADPRRVVTPLAGVQHDVVSAMAMARLLQVPAENMTVLRDGAATREGVREALRELDTRVKPGDRVFFYWSGHGSRYFDPAADGCVETLVPYDLRDIGNRDFAALLQPLAMKADKMFVVYDACHSGGVDGTSSIATRSMPVGYTPKFTPAEAMCQPINIRNRGFDNATRAIGLSSQDIVHISSARPNEVSFDNADFGGLATSSLLQCLLGEARDLDGSGSISVEEIAVCAQSQMETKLKPFPHLEPNHLVISGNRAFVPAWFASDSMPSAQQPTATHQIQTTAQIKPPSNIPSRPEHERLASLQTVLEQIHDQRDSKRKVSVTATKPILRIGVDELDFSVTSSHDGYVYMAMLGSDQKTLYLAFPNALDTRNRIVAGESLLLPRSNWRIQAGGPKGKDTVLVIVTDSPRNLDTLGGGQSGPFTMPLTDESGRTRLQWMLGQKGELGSCSAPSCSDAFGSAVVTIEEH